jgi:RNA 3'-terminal phosphate cyclase (ATP)
MVRSVKGAGRSRGLRSPLAAAKQARRYINSTAAIGEHLADQLLLPLALSDGGSFTTTPLSSHATTNLDVIRRFLDVRAEVSEISRGVTLVRFGHDDGRSPLFRRMA